MSFQSTVYINQGFGVPGELMTDSPVRSQPYTLVSSPVDNVVGYAFTISSEGVAQCGGTGEFAGILANPKAYALFGTTAGTLTPTLLVPDNTEGEIVEMGEIIVQLAGTASVGDKVIYDETTGELSAIAPGASIGAGYSPAYATVSRYDVGSNGIAVIMVTKTPTIS